ncbi:MAG: methyltransferase domain-containing protein [Spirochaetales bacterium]|nr:methyltransferase domain-containing protein [Spirochaetales bacterium]
MKKTDYSKIADRYDKNEIRHRIPKDILIKELYTNNGNSLDVLDLACGTGNYIEKQIQYYRDYNIHWTGADLCKEMLQKAINKNLKAAFIHADAHNLPFEQETFDYVKVNCAIHHFEDKKKAVSEIARILRRNGVLSIFNICHDYMKKSWVYDYFPGSIAIDKERFLATDTLYHLFKNSGFHVTACVSVVIKEFPYDGLIKEVRNRDMSQLTLISEQEYQAGLDRLLLDSKEKEVYTGDFAFLDFAGKKT